MKTTLKLPMGVFEDIRAHLLPRGSIQEQAAFLFVGPQVARDATFELLEYEKLGPADFDVQESDYLELRDESRARLIKRAHDLKASLVEVHSHPGPWPASFSMSDRRGLRETVPHMWWRLPKRPYLAIVVAPSGFDALVWLDNPKVPRALDELVAGTTMMKPTNNSLKGWQ